MKGDANIYREIVIFIMGIGLTLLIVTGVDNIIDDNFAIKSIENEMENLSNLIISSMVKLSKFENGRIEIEIPNLLIDNEYSIEVINNGDVEILRIKLLNQDINIDKKIFKIKDGYNNIERSTVYGSDSKLYLTKIGNTIKIGADE